MTEELVRLRSAWDAVYPQFRAQAEAQAGAAQMLQVAELADFFIAGMIGLSLRIQAGEAVPAACAMCGQSLIFNEMAMGLTVCWRCNEAAKKAATPSA
jgi:hypothetical protein